MDTFFFVQLLLVTSTIVRQMLKYLFSSLPCNTNLFGSERIVPSLIVKLQSFVFCVSMK